MKRLIEKSKADICFIFCALLLNPVLWEIKNRIVPLFPDSVAYIVLSKKLLSDAKLYVDQWGHIDHGLILPPVYPFFIGIADFFVNDGPLAAELVSSLMIVSSSFPLYFFVKNLSSRLCAFFTILLVQMNYFYLFFGTVALSEATFIFLLCCGFWLIQKSLKSDSPNFYLLFLGFTSALIFLTRHVGITFIFTMLFFFLVVQFKKISFAEFSLYILGILLLLVPYSFLLFHQTGQTYLTQHFRFGDYVVQYSEAAVSDQGEIDSSDYGALYEQRRNQRALLVDSSEIISYSIKPDAYVSDKFKTPLSLLGKLRQPEAMFRNIVNNCFHLVAAVGLLNVFTLLFVYIFSLLRRRGHFPGRVLLPLFLVIYMLFMSLLTSAVDRYVIVVFPFAFAVLCIELYHFIGEFKFGAKQKGLFFTLAATVILFLIPSKSLGIKTYPKDREQLNHLKLCSNHVSDGDSVFTIHPYFAYVLGGNYRILPNDSLEKIAKYATFTGVKWMLLPNLDETKSEYQMYTNAKWILGVENPAQTYPDLVKLRCRIDNNYWLFELNPSGPEINP